MKKIDLSKASAQKVRRLVPWLYRNELPRTLWCEAGETCTLAHQGRYLATAFINPKSQLAARIVTYDSDALVDDAFITGRIERAVAKRHAIPSNAKRLVHAEADGLPGLIADVYGEYLVFSITSAGMERFKPTIIEAFKRLLPLKGIRERSDALRQKEGLALDDAVYQGTFPSSFIIEEGDKRFQTDLLGGQKTGFFLDQRRNRAVVGRYCGKRTLDLFANAGGFGIYAYADFTKFVEISADACRLIETNCRLNGIKRYEIVRQDVFAFLEKEKQTYDLIILDPPAFAKSKKAKPGALRGWKYLIDKALDILEYDGYLALFSCSHAVGLDDLRDTAHTIAACKGIALEVIETLYQDRDHPFMLHIPNSLYLTGYLLRKCRL